MHTTWNVCFALTVIASLLLSGGTAVAEPGPGHTAIDATTPGIVATALAQPSMSQPLDDLPPAAQAAISQALGRDQRAYHAQAQPDGR